MKKTLLILIASFFVKTAIAQTTIAFHQSNLPFIGVNYQFGERFIPEFRVSTDQYFGDVSVELVANYIFKKTDRFEFYGGIGPKVGNFAGAVIPVGLNIYPFEKKDFGFQMEGAGIVGNHILFRGSFGIRYRFQQD